MRTLYNGESVQLFAARVAPQLLAGMLANPNNFFEPDDMDQCVKDAVQQSVALFEMILEAEQG